MKANKIAKSMKTIGKENCLIHKNLGKNGHTGWSANRLSISQWEKAFANEF